MKVLMVNKFLHPNGGSETYIFKLGDMLKQQGHQVQYFGMEHDNRIVGNDIGCYTCNMDFHTGKLKKLIYPFKIIYSHEARKKILKVLKNFEPDVVHINNFNFQLTPSIIYGIREFSKKTGKKIRIIYTAHDLQLVCPNHLMRIPSNGQLCNQCINNGYRSCIKNKCIHDSKIKSILGAFEGWLYKKTGVYRYIDCIICPSEFLANQLQTYKAIADRIVVMHNFVKSSSEFKKKENYVLYFGRYSEEKGMDTLIEICKELKDIPFVFAGSGPYKEQISELNNVKDIGFLNENSMRETIMRARFVVVPSKCYENCPFSVMEAIAAGTPVIGSDIGGIPELIDNGRTGLLCEMANVADFKSKILLLWNDLELNNKFIANCQEARFDSLEEYCEKLLRIYKSI